MDRESQISSYVTWRRRSERVGGGQHRGLLQSDQHVVRHHHRVLHRAVLSRHVSRSKIWGVLKTWIYKYVLPKLFQYHWADGNQVKKPIKCSAPKYIDFLMTWVQDQLDDETLFPSKIGVPFPNNFLTNAKTILKRLFRVYAHVYHQHFKVKILNSWSIIR